MALQLALSWAILGRDVLLVDEDRQGSASLAVAVRAEGERMPGLSCAAYPDGPALHTHVRLMAPKFDYVVVDAGGRDSGAVQQAAASLHMPASLATQFQGNVQAFQSSVSSTPPLILAALFAVYVILGILYESTIHPLTILSTLPSAGLGALATLMLFGRPLDVIGIIGVILLIGIVKKNGIMLVDFALHAERERGLSCEEAIHEACRLRFRPILMTTLCALLGGVPLMLGTGTGSEIRQPLGYATVGGLLVSQVLTLFTTPVVYIYMDRLSTWIGRLRDGPSPRAQALGSD